MEQSALGKALSVGTRQEMQPFQRLAEVLRGYRRYDYEDLWPFCRSGSPAGAESALDATGRNAFSVLRNWRAGDRDHAERDRFVRSALEEAFPDAFADYDFTAVGPVVFARFYAPGRREPTFPALTAHGILVGLLHLAAVASTPDGGIVAIDEPENGLHPRAIQRIVGAVRDWADQHDLTVLLATHSPVLIDEFKRDPEHLFVMEPGHDTLPVRLDEVRDRDWLAQFSLGDLYKHGDFGAPAPCRSLSSDGDGKSMRAVMSGP